MFFKLHLLISCSKKCLKSTSGETHIANLKSVTLGECSPPLVIAILNGNFVVSFCIKITCIKY